MPASVSQRPALSSEDEKAQCLSWWRADSRARHQPGRLWRLTAGLSLPCVALWQGGPTNFDQFRGALP